MKYETLKNLESHPSNPNPCPLDHPSTKTYWRKTLCFKKCAFKLFAFTSCFIFAPQVQGWGAFKWHPFLKTNGLIKLKFQFWAFDSGRLNKGWVKSFSGPLPGPRGHKLKDQFLKIVDFQKVIQKGYLKHLSPLWDPWPQIPGPEGPWSCNLKLLGL